MRSPAESTNRAYYDDFSARYERSRRRGYHAWLDGAACTIAAPLCAGGRVLEAGCGTGLILTRLASVANTALGVDLSRRMLERADQRGLSVVQGDLLSLPFADQAFDVVCSFKVLAHIRDIERAVAELWRVTRPGGHLVMDFYNAWSLRYLAKRLSGPRAISLDRTEADVFTRWDTPHSIHHHFPADAELVALHGVRVLTPVALLHRLPVLDRVLPALERRAATSPVRVFGGFLVAVLRKRGRR